MVLRCIGRTLSREHQLKPQYNLPFVFKRGKTFMEHQTSVMKEIFEGKSPEMNALKKMLLDSGRVIPARSVKAVQQKLGEAEPINRPMITVSASKFSPLEGKLLRIEGDPTTWPEAGPNGFIVSVAGKTLADAKFDKTHSQVLKELCSKAIPDADTPEDFAAALRTTSWLTKEKQLTDATVTLVLNIAKCVAQQTEITLGKCLMKLLDCCGFDSGKHGLSLWPYFKVSYMTPYNSRFSTQTECTVLRDNPQFVGGQEIVLIHAANNRHEERYGTRKRGLLQPVCDTLTAALIRSSKRLGNKPPAEIMLELSMVESFVCGYIATYPQSYLTHLRHGTLLQATELPTFRIWPNPSGYNLCRHQDRSALITALALYHKDIRVDRKK